MQKIIHKINASKIWLVLFWTFFLFVNFLMFIELPEREGGIPYLDKVVHVFLFSLLTIFGAMAWKPHGYWLAAALILYGAVIEPLQAIFTLTRQASIYDWLANVAGIIIASVIIVIFNRTPINKYF